MTVSSIVPVNTYTGNSTVKKFDFDFLIESENELIVQHISEDNVITTLTLGVDYSINEIGNQNGSYIIFPLENSSYNILKENEKITLMLTLIIKQESEFKNSSYFNLNILEWTFDYIVRILQILSRKIERCVKVGEGLSSSPDELMDELNESKRIAINAADSALESKNIAEENKNECIEYLEEYNQKVIEFNNEYNKCLQSIIDKGIYTRCDLDLSNLSETGEKHFLNKSQITNCILEIPQNIMLEINNGQIILKSGSKLYFPNGTGNFDVVTTTEDKNLGAAASSETYLLTVTKNLVPRHAYKKTIYSGNTEPDLSSQTSNFAIWYDTTNNVIKQTSDKGASWTGEWSFPICEYICSEPNKVKSVTNIFNGIGYIGSTIFVLPNVKGVFPWGRNADKTLNNIEYKMPYIKTYTISISSNAKNLSIVLDNNSGIGFNSYLELDFVPEARRNDATWILYRKDNRVYQWNSSESKYALKTSSLIELGKADTVNGAITSFTPNSPFRAMDYNDFINNGFANVICTTAPTTVSTASAQNPAVIVENYVNGTSGYRVYSDGYCEQWGLTSENYRGTVTLLKPYINADYNIGLNIKITNGSTVNGGESAIGNVKVNSFDYSIEDAEPRQGGYWVTRGYIK